MASELIRRRRKLYPPFFRTVVRDTRMTLNYRGEAHLNRGRLRLVWQMIRLCVVADAYFAQVCYRAKCRLARFHIPLLPWILHRISMMHSQVCIGSPVVIGPGLYLPHGQVVIDGVTTLGDNCIVFPWVTVGLKSGIVQGPSVGTGVHIGTGAKVIGPISVGDGVMIGANAVVVDDLPAGCTAVGMPARPLG